MDSFKRLVEQMVEDQRRLQEQLKQALGPPDTLSEAIKQALGPSDALREAMKQAFGPSDALRETIKQALGPSDALRETIKPALGPSDALRETIKQALGPSDALRETIKQALGPSDALRETMRQMMEPYRGLRDAVMQTMIQQAEQARPPRHFTFISEAQKQWASHAEIYFSGLPPDAINITPSGDIVLGRKTVTSEDVAKNLALLDKQLSTASTPVDCFRCIFSFLSRLSMPRARILFLILYTYMMGELINLTTPIYQPWWEELTGLPKQEVATKIRENALNRYDPSQLKDHRFVTANRLQVRVAPGKEQRVIGTLPRGKLVRVIKSKQSWTKVKYLDERQRKERQGWVATSHLGKLTE